MSKKLDYIGAYNRPQILEPILTSIKREEHVGNASPKHSDKELGMLRADNAKLKKDYDELNIILKQLTRETSHEKFDERRVNLLKLQIIQLEKQVCILNEALGGRHGAMLEVENTMAWLADKLRSFISAEIKGPVVPIARADLMSIVESTESARIKLFKTIEGSAKESVGKDLLFLNPFLGGRYKQEENITLLDISLNRMDYLNLRHVAQLESKLCTLYKDLIRLFEQVEYAARGSSSVKQGKSAESTRLKTTILKTCVTLKDAADDLLSLSLLCPSSPWPALKRPLTKQVPLDRVKLALPNGLPAQKQEQINHIIESSIGVCNHRYLVLEKEKAVLKEELNFHRATHDLQVEYTKALFEAVRKGYGEFENSAREIVVEPIKNLLDAYRELKDSGSEQALREFLVIIKENEEQLSYVEKMFEKEDFGKEETGASAFSRFESDFFSKLEVLAEQCQKQRDQAIRSRKDVAEEQSRIDLELQHMIEDLEAKYEKQWNPVKKYGISKVFENESVLNMDKSESVQTTNTSARKDAKLHISNSRSSARNGKNDAFVLRSYLDSDNVASYNSLEKGTCSTPASCQTNDGMEKTDSPQVLGKRGKNLSKKKKWEPDQEWVGDFSGLTEKDANASTETTGYAHKPQNDKKTKVKSPALDSPDSSNPLGACDDMCTNNESSKSVPSKVKKCTYEPGLYVANRTLKLRRAGSLSGLKPSDQADNQNDCGIKREISDNARSGTPKIHSQPMKSQPKPVPFQKRNSWR